jgi:hypothetical protein
VIPYDYAARLELNGTRGRVVQDAISISAEGTFVAVAIGYGFEEESGESVGILPSPSGAGAYGGGGTLLATRGALRSVSVVTLPVGSVIVPGDVTLDEVPIRALIDGVRINPQFQRLVFESEWLQAAVDPAAAVRLPEFSNQPLPIDLAVDTAQRAGTEQLLFERVRNGSEISFLFNVLDSGSGRELQDEPIHNLASLGKSNGERPFRPLAQPLTFLPRSSIRVQVVERSDRTRGTLFIVFYGYKILAPGCGEPVMRALRGPAGCRTETIGRPVDGVVPFDYAASLELAGQRDRLVETEVPISTDGAFVATALGYGLATGSQDVPILWDSISDIDNPTVLDAARAAKAEYDTARRELDAWRRTPAAIRPPSPPAQRTIDLSTLPVRLLGPDALVDGIRIRSDFLRLAIGVDGRLSAQLPALLADQVFERVGRADNVSFRYLITDAGRGIELQNQFIHNVAGLGIANGDRPFKKFARPMEFGPRSSIRVSVRERSGRGILQLVFHGYKVLPSRGGRA